MTGLIACRSSDPASLLVNRRAQDPMGLISGKRAAPMRAALRPPRSFLRWRKRHASTNIAAGPRAATL